MRRVLGFLALSVALLASLTPASAQGYQPATAPPWVYAADFGRWALPLQAPNTYTFQPTSVCYLTKLNYPQGQTFYAFSNSVALAPVLVQDVNQAVSEVVTPGSFLTPTSTTCGPAIAPSNNHKTATLQSGTGGLQEAINAVGTSTQPYPVTVFLTQDWYKQVANITSQKATVTAQSIVAAATGTSQVQLVDITQTPWVTYRWDGVSFKAEQAGAAVPNLNVSSLTGITAPAALSTSASTNGLITTAATGGTVAAATYRLAATYVDASGGETLISTDSASTATIATSGSTSTITVTSPAAATGAVGWRLYMSASGGAAGSEILYTPTCSIVNQSLQSVLVPATVCPIGATATITAVVTGTATVPIIANAYPRTAGSSQNFPSFTAAGTVAAAATQTLGIVNFPAGWLNTLGRSWQVCGNGFGTTNSTAGTLTVATTLASVPGVTSITPFTAVSGATAASAQADPFDFCVTYTTTATGASGTLEAHGWVLYSLAGTAPGTPAIDIITAASSAIDLTKQDQLAVTIKPTTTALTAAQLRQLTITPLN